MLMANAEPVNQLGWLMGALPGVLLPPLVMSIHLSERDY